MFVRKLNDGQARKVTEVMTPNVDPPPCVMTLLASFSFSVLGGFREESHTPRVAQNRSWFWHSLRVKNSPVGDTISNSRTASAAMPNVAAKAAWPPPVR
jgi:hypothetical protein